MAFTQIIEVSPEDLDFGDVAIDEVGKLALTVRNVGDRELVHGTIIPFDTDHFGILIPEASAASETIGAIYNAVKMYRQDLGEDPSSVEELLDLHYLEIDEEIQRQWNFTLIGSNPITQIEAVSTFDMPGGRGHQIIFDVETGRFSGYGMSDDEAPFELDEEEAHTFLIKFMPDEVRNFEGIMGVFVYDADYNLVETVEVPLRGNGVLAVQAGQVDLDLNGFYLSAAYPNPFNTVTNISYALPIQSSVSVRVYDARGCLVETFVNGEKPAGYHTAIWSGRNISAGVYFVRMEAGGFNSVRKVILVK